MGYGASAEPLVGEVTRVFDGDTVVVHSAGTAHRVRLAEIDAPESHQDGGKASRAALLGKVGGYQVRLEVISSIDHYGRLIGRLHRGDRDVNRELVAEAHAWAAQRVYLTDRSFLIDEEGARVEKLGLWADPNPVPPWEWRRGKTSTRDRPQTPARLDMQCGTKRLSSQVASCAEGEFYLNQCGVSHLDRDKDGTPCEKLCR